MPIPIEPIGSIPRPPDLILALQANQGRDVGLDALFDAAVADTVARFEATGSPVVTDGEQRKFHTFWNTACTACCAKGHFVISSASTCFSKRHCG